MNRFLNQLLARDPRKEVRFPDLPLDDALRSLEKLQETLAALQLAANSAPAPVIAPLEAMPPVIVAEPPSPPAAPAPVAEPAPAAPPTPPASSSLPATPVPTSPENDEALSSALAALATQVWRAHAKTVDPVTGEPREEMRRVHRHVGSALEVFGQMGLSLNDWVRQPYDAGLPVKVLTYQPTPGIDRDTVLEAVRPAVTWNGRLLQMGEVIVGTPQEGAEKI